MTEREPTTRVDPCPRALPAIRGFVLATTFLASFATPAAAQDAVLDTGDTAWILVSTALVLFMTIPGLALFYGGLVRTKNMLSVHTVHDPHRGHQHRLVRVRLQPRVR